MLDPWVVQATFKKIDNKWRVLNLVECGVEQSVNTETSNQLNSVELENQFIGSGKYEFGKDPTGYTYFTTIYGTGIDINCKLVSKGKTVWMQRINRAYDKTLNKFIGLSQIKGGDVCLFSWWFIPKNIYFVSPFASLQNRQTIKLKY